VEIRRFLSDICEVYGVSGFEHQVAALIKAALCPFADQVRQDKLGNVAFYKRGEREEGAGPRILLAAHMDEIGLMITKIEEGGFLRFAPVGGIDPRAIVGQEVLIFGRKALPGVIGAKPPHLTDADEREKGHEMEDLFIDLVLSEQEVRRQVSAGDLAVIRRESLALAGNTFVAKALDDRAGVAVLLHCLQELSKLRHRSDVFAVVTVQEEVGVRGATVSAYGILPDIGIAVDVTHGEMPGVPEHETAQLGKGPVICLGPNIHPKLGAELQRLAKECLIPHQLEVSPGPTATDARAIQVTRDGIPAALISIPLRYMHTSVELVDLEDVRQAGRLLAHFIVAVDMAFVEGLTCY